jgi:uncharacterized repeat protein (TIGR03803 family)
MVSPRPAKVLSLTALPVMLVVAALAQGQIFTTLHNFTGGSDGSNPYSAVIQDSEGNLYGTAKEGGDLSCIVGGGCGVVYKLDAAGTETVLHSFTGSPDGAWPETPLVRDEAGNIYGTTFYGGVNCTTGYGCGAVFKIDAAGKEKVLYSFTGGSDGCDPSQGLVRDSAGNLYGTTYACGSSNMGTIFKVDRTGNFTLLHALTGSQSDGGSPQYGHLTMDKSGNLYGVTVNGGAYGAGVLYKLSKTGKFTVLHSFEANRSDGCNPYGTVARDIYGNLYGTTYECGNSGMIWKVSKTGKETILHNFAGGTSDGCLPYAGVTLDSQGTLYGTTSSCGKHGTGTLYKVSGDGKLTILHNFGRVDGEPPVGPFGEVLRTNKGTLLGTTYWGGSDDSGTVWSYMP